MRANQEIFDISKESLFANKSFAEQANVIINWKSNHLNPQKLFCLSDNANKVDIGKRYMFIYVLPCFTIIIYSNEIIAEHTFTENTRASCFYDFF